MPSPPDAPLSEEKRVLRRAVRATRDRLSAPEHARASQAAADRLLTVPEFLAARTLAAFAPARGEIDVGAAVAARLGAGVRVVYPRVTADTSLRLKFHVVLHPGQLRPGAFGIPEPAADADEVAVDEIDVVLAPGLAFDPTGRRLGYGGGFYDEVAARLREKFSGSARGLPVRLAGGPGLPAGPAGPGARGFLLGVGFDFQLFETIPAGEGDVSIDCVVTDARVVRCH